MNLIFTSMNKLVLLRSYTVYTLFFLFVFHFHYHLFWTHTYCFSIYQLMSSVHRSGHVILCPFLQQGDVTILCWGGRNGSVHLHRADARTEWRHPMMNVCVFLTDKRGDESCRGHTGVWGAASVQCVFMSGRRSVCMHNPVTPCVCPWGVHCALPPILFRRSLFLPLLEIRTRSLTADTLTNLPS